eukprot:CAMPEP_0177688852 /NCGR_PEP_ID=MMETSP0447-20121125/34866_1 /TAXON_ID=0 /ORGANISM="Stygamoeba regulata, Strain BSH-02190019" /LENGTH=549 /DNA_ID=CAMNT_0019199155 /DNA_START=47 /DNA_END=1696 /DNA_ORIENTATION=+
MSTRSSKETTSAGLRRLAVKLSQDVLSLVAEYTGTDDERNRLCQLLQLCARNRVLPATSDGNTPMHVAALNNNLHSLRFLHAVDMDVNSKNLFLETPLHLACVNDCIELVALLLAYKADVSAQSAEQLTPLHMCALHHSYASLLYLARSGRCASCVDELDGNGMTPLHLLISRLRSDVIAECFSEEPFVECVEALLQQGASPLPSITSEASFTTNSFTLAREVLSDEHLQPYHQAAKRTLCCMAAADPRVAELSRFLSEVDRADSAQKDVSKSARRGARSSHPHKMHQPRVNESNDSTLDEQQESNESALDEQLESEVDSPLEGGQTPEQATGLVATASHPPVDPSLAQTDWQTQRRKERKQPKSHKQRIHKGNNKSKSTGPRAGATGAKELPRDGYSRTNHAQLPSQQRSGPSAASGAGSERRNPPGELTTTGTTTTTSLAATASSSSWPATTATSSPAVGVKAVELSSEALSEFAEVHPHFAALDLRPEHLFGVHLSALSMAQLDALEDIFHSSLRRVTEAKLSLVRTQAMLSQEEAVRLTLEQFGV